MRNWVVLEKLKRTRSPPLQDLEDLDYAVRVQARGCALNPCPRPSHSHAYTEVGVGWGVRFALLSLFSPLSTVGNLMLGPCTSLPPGAEAVFGILRFGWSVGGWRYGSWLCSRSIE